MATNPQALCPSCESAGALGQPCPERVCSRLGVHFIPVAEARSTLSANAHQREPLIGHFIGDYLIVERLGKGGFGKVLLGVQKPLFKLKAAVKLLDMAGAADSSTPDPYRAKVASRMVQKFENEAAALAALHHPNVVRLLQYGQFQGQPFLVMEFVPGRRTLQTEINRAVANQTGLRLERIRHVLTQVLNGLEAAHDQDTIHRDIKPENIMLQSVVGDAWHVKLVDFGLAKVIADSRETSLVLGTVAYMAPEQIEGHNLGPWTDLYAVAAIAFELVTGHRAFVGEDTQDILRQKLSSSFDPFARFEEGHDLPEAVTGFLRKGLARQPSDRFQSTRAMRNAMEEVFADGMFEAEFSADLSGLVDSSEVMLLRQEFERLESARMSLEEERRELELVRKELDSERVRLRSERMGTPAEVEFAAIGGTGWIPPVDVPSQALQRPTGMSTGISRHKTTAAPPKRRQMWWLWLALGAVGLAGAALIGWSLASRPDAAGPGAPIATGPQVASSPEPAPGPATPSGTLGVEERAAQANSDAATVHPAGGTPEPTDGSAPAPPKTDRADAAVAATGEPAIAPKAPEFRKVRLESTPPATVQLDGSSLGTTPVTLTWHDGEPLPRPRLTAPGFQTLEVSLAADDLERGVRAIRLERVPSQPKKKPVATKPTEEMPTW